jgi:hypothetical protein
MHHSRTASGFPNDAGPSEDSVRAGHAKAQRCERHEGDPPPGALVEHGLGHSIGQVELVLDAGHVGDPQCMEQMRGRDVAQPDRGDQAVLSRRDHRGQLIVDEAVRLGTSYQAEVDGGKGGDAERSEVLLDVMAELSRFLGGEDLAVPVPPGTDLADQDQVLGVGEERLANELVHHIRPVELGGVDVVDATVDCLAQHGECLVAVVGWPEHTRPREAHRPEADGGH